jgi:hypothetical protein
MWRSKKFILIGLLIVIVLGSTLGGIAIAQANDESTNQTQTTETTLMQKVASIYEKNTGTAIDPTKLQEAFQEAQKEMMTAARDTFLQKLVDEGKITQDEADQYKAWLDSKPDCTNKIMPFGGGRPGPRGFFGGFNRGPNTSN